MRREYEVKLQVYGENAKLSHLTAGDSTLRSPNMRSPAHDYTMTSPDYGNTRMVDSQIKTTTGGDQATRLGADTSRSSRL
mgnify:CR=1 FL=1|jgi:hypothetical protein